MIGTAVLRRSCNTAKNGLSLNHHHHLCVSASVKSNFKARKITEQKIDEKHVQIRGVEYQPQYYENRSALFTKDQNSSSKICCLCQIKTPVKYTVIFSAADYSLVISL